MAWIIQKVMQMGTVRKKQTICSYWHNGGRVMGMGVYFFEKSLSFQGPILCVVFEILKLPQNCSPKFGLVIGI